MQLSAAKRILGEAKRLVASIENNDPVSVVTASLISIMALCQTALFAGAVKVFNPLIALPTIGLNGHGELEEGKRKAG